MDKRKFLIALSAVIVIALIITAYITLPRTYPEQRPIRLAVEFTDHAAGAFVAMRKGFFKENGLNVTAFNYYITGPALAAALGREDIDAAYICLIPAIAAYANAKVPIKIVAGMHKYGYALVVNESKVKTVKDLEKPDVRISCVNKGSPPDVLLNKLIEEYQLDKEKILSKVQYMPPPNIILALKAGLVDAAFLPEQYPTMAEELGFKVLLTAQDLWPDMQGSVLVVKEDLIKKDPETVRMLVKATQQGIRYVQKNLEESSQIVAEELQVAGKQILPSEVANVAGQLRITPSTISKSLTTRVICDDRVDVKAVQDTIDYMAKLGYIHWFRAEDILDLSFLEGS